MTKLLEEAFAEASKLPEQAQDALAAVILEELASERRWDQAFADSADLLAQLADQALAEYRAGTHTCLIQSGYDLPYHVGVSDRVRTTACAGARASAGGL